MSHIHQPVPLEGVETPARAEPVAAAEQSGGLVADALALTKPGIVRLVTITSCVGLALASIESGASGWFLARLFVVTMLGTAFAAAGANTLNQAVERRRDSLMERTQSRPVASGRWTPMHAALFGAVLSVLGCGVLAIGANVAAAGVALATILLYVAVYTPMKSMSPMATIVGAVPGALPPLIGWAAGSGGAWFGLVQPGGWTLFLIVFVWQIPHFLAIAWKYRTQYARAGIAVLPVSDPSGARTAGVVVLWSCTLLLVTLMPLWSMRIPLGVLYGGVALLGGLVMVAMSVRFAQQRTDESARALFLASVMHLPLVLVAMVADAFLIS